jgi:CheY-like chemotaxis protein
VTEPEPPDPEERRPEARILIVDDNHANLTALEAILQPLGHHVVRAGSGEEALKVLLRSEVALIIMDVRSSSWTCRCRGSTASRRRR